LNHVMTESTPPKVMVSLNGSTPPKVVLSLDDLEEAAGISPPKVKLSLVALEELLEIKDTQQKEEDEWEHSWANGLDSLHISPPSSSSTAPPASIHPRGRGAHKFHNKDTAITDESDSNNKEDEDDQDEPQALPSHILEIFNIPPSSTTVDVEQYLEPYRGAVKIKWVNDTTALALFRSPSVAREALPLLSHPSMKLRLLHESPPEVKAKALSLSSSSSAIPTESAPRPYKTTTTVARRLIANALQIPSKEMNTIT